MRLGPTLILAVAIFVPQLSGGIYRGLDRSVPDGLRLLTVVLLFIGVAGWFWSYASHYRIALPMDIGLFLMWTWPLLVPYYILSREGRHGLQRLALFAFTYFAAWACGSAIAIWLHVLR